VETPDCNGLGESASSIAGDLGATLDYSPAQIEDALCVE